MNFLFSTAWAAEAPPPGGQFSGILMLVFVLVIFYFMIIRPQQKRVKEHEAMTKGLAKGDEIVTNGGVIGKVAKIHDNFIALSVSENIELMVQKNAVANVLPKGTIKNLQ